jgi:hypothetical protein
MDALSDSPVYAFNLLSGDQSPSTLSLPLGEPLSKERMFHHIQMGGASTSSEYVRKPFPEEGIQLVSPVGETDDTTMSSPSTYVGVGTPLGSHDPYIPADVASSDSPISAETTQSMDAGISDSRVLKLLSLGMLEQLADRYGHSTRKLSSATKGLQTIWVPDPVMFSLEALNTAEALQEASTHLLTAVFSSGQAGAVLGAAVTALLDLDACVLPLILSCKIPCDPTLHSLG